MNQRNASEFADMEPPVGLSSFIQIRAMGHGVDLIIVLSVREREDLNQEIISPMGVSGKIDVAVFDHCGNE